MQKIRDKSPMKSRRKEEKEEKEKEGKKQRIKARLSGRISPSPTRGESAEEGIGATPERDGSGFLAPPTPSPIRFEGGFVKGDGLGALHLDRNSIIISIVGAKDLKDVDLIGVSDPWVKVIVRDLSGVKQRMFKTKTIDNNLNPVWDEDFMFIFRFGETAEDYILNLEVYDEGKTGKTFLGMCAQPMANIMGNRPGRIMEMKLEPKKKGDHVKGTIQFNVRYPTSQEIEELSSNFSSKIAKNLVSFIAFSCVDSIVKIRPDTAIFELEAEISILNIVFIYIFNVIIPFGAPPDCFEIKVDTAYENLKLSCAAKGQSLVAQKGGAVIQSLPEDMQKLLTTFVPRFIEHLQPVLDASRRAPSGGGGSELQMGLGIKPIIKIPPPPSPSVVGMNVALRAIFASGGKKSLPPPQRTFAPIGVTRAARAVATGEAPAKEEGDEEQADTAGQGDSEPTGATWLKGQGGGPSPSLQGEEKSCKSSGGWKPAGVGLGVLHVEKNSVIIRVAKADHIKYGDILGKVNPYVKVIVTDRSGNLAKKFKTPVVEKDKNKDKEEKVKRDDKCPVWDEDLLYIFPFGRTVEDFVVTLEVYHRSLKGKKFLGMCQRPLIDVIGKNPGELAEMQLQPKDQGDSVKGTISFSVRYPTPEEIQDIGQTVSSKVAKNLVSYVLFSCADAVVKTISLPSGLRFECEAEITVLNLCFIFVMNICIPIGSGPTTFEDKKKIAFEQLRIAAAVKGQDLLQKIPENMQTAIDSYLPRFMEQLMPVVESARRPTEGSKILLELGVGMKPILTLPLPPNPPVLTLEIAFRVFFGIGGSGESEPPKPAPPRTFAPILNRPEEMKQREEHAQEVVLRGPSESPAYGLGVLDLEKGSVIINIDSCNGLKNVDIRGKSDPFVKMTIMDRSGVKAKKFRSTARKDNLDPVFNEDFMFIFPFNRNVDDYILVLEVRDKGIKGSTFLGMCEKPMVDVMNGKTVEMKLEPKQKGDHVKGNIRFSLRAPTSKDIEELGADLASKIARNLIAYIAFSAADALVRLRPKSARFECEAEITVLNLCFIFIVAVVIPFGSPPDLFEVRKDTASENLKATIASQKSEIMAKIPKNAEAMLTAFLPKFLEQATPLIEIARKDSDTKIQTQVGVGIKPEFVLPFPPAPRVVGGNVALRVILGKGGSASAEPIRTFAFHKEVE